ncbi:MAG: adenylosuccinate synthetase [Roseiflexaceae bacterium]|nr:adenylosuccinate synthetase [Roseiflexus sp.]MDW8213539.1 adenylosuccinate synthetase [Roseiflexaceae bacterium]
MRRAFLTVDLGFGDAGKGTIVDWLTRETGAHTVIRYNGGPQAAHRVVTPDPQPCEHIFSQFGSGTLAGAETYLSRFMLIDPLAMTAEERHLCEVGVEDAFQRTAIDEGALIITPFQRAANRLSEIARGAARHGSCGMGVGETMIDALTHGSRALRAVDLKTVQRLREKLRFAQEVNRAKLERLRPVLPDTPAVADEVAWLEDAGAVEWLVGVYGDLAPRLRIVGEEYLAALLRRTGTVIFEGAQGVLLDEWHGFHPHTTWSTTTLANAGQLLTDAGFNGSICRIGITRAYATRHGAGPFVTEEACLTTILTDARNQHHPWQGSFRVGWLDFVMLRYACDVTGSLDMLAVTCLDRLAEMPSVQICRRYRCNDTLIERIAPAPAPSLAYQERLTRTLWHCRPVLEPVTDAEALLTLLACALNTPVGITSWGPTAREKRLTAAGNAAILWSQTS